MPKWKQDHIIQKLTFEIDINEKSKFHPLADRLGTIVRNSLQQKIEEVLDEFSQLGRVIEIHTLEINLGNIAEKDLERVLKERMIKALREKLKKQISKARPYQKSQVVASSSSTISASQMAESVLSGQVTNVAREDLLKQQIIESQQNTSITEQTPVNIAKEDLSRQQLLEEEEIQQQIEKNADASTSLQGSPTNAAKIDLLFGQTSQKERQDKTASTPSTQPNNAAKEDELIQQNLAETVERKATDKTSEKTTNDTIAAASKSQQSSREEKIQEENIDKQQTAPTNAAQEDVLLKQTIEQTSLLSPKADTIPITSKEQQKQREAEQKIEETTDTETAVQKDAKSASSLVNTAQDDLLRQEQAQFIKREEERTEAQEQIIKEAQERSTKEQIIKEAQKKSTKEQIIKEAQEKNSKEQIIKEKKDSTSNTPTNQARRRIPDISEITSVPISKNSSSEETTPPKRKKPFKRGPYYLDTAYKKAQNPFSEKKTPFKGADPANMDIPVYRADYSHQVDGIVYFLQRGRLPDWFSLGEATLDDLMIDLLEEYPQIIRPRLKELVEEKMILDRLTEQFLPETLAKIQEIADIEIDEDAMNAIFDVREQASVSPFIQATIEQDYLYILFVNGVVPWWIKNVESDNLEVIVSSGAGYNFFKDLLTQTNSLAVSKRILRNILKYLTEVDIQNLFSDYRKHEFGEETLLFIILDIATVEGLHFKDTLVEVLKALDGIGDTIIIPREKDTQKDADVSKTSPKETETTEKPNEYLYALFVDGVKAPWLQYLPADRLEAMITSAANSRLFSNILTEERSIDSFKNILQRMLEHLSDAAIENIFKTYRKDNFGQATLLYKILDTTAFEQSSFKVTLTSFIKVLQAGRLPENIVPKTDESANKDLYALFVDGVKAPWLQYLPTDRLESVITSTANSKLFSNILTEERSIHSFKNILQRMLEHLSDTAIENIFKTYQKDNFGPTTLLYKILDTRAFEQSNFKATLTSFIKVLQTGHLPENIVPKTNESANKDLYALFVDGVKAPWLQYLPADRLEVMMTSAANLSIFSNILSQSRSTDSFKNILQHILEHLSDAAIENIFKTYRKDNFGPVTLLYKILDTTAFEQSSFKATLTSFINILQSGRLPENIVPKTNESANKDLYALFVDGVKAPWLQYLPADRLEAMMTSSANLSIFSDILSQSRSTDSFKNILQHILKHLSDTVIENIFKTYRKDNLGRDTLLYKILDTTNFEQSTFKATLTSFINILQAGRLPENIVPKTNESVNKDLHVLFIDGIKAPWLQYLSADRLEAMMTSVPNVSIFSDILSQSRSTDSFKNILQRMLEHLSDAAIENIFKTYRKDNFGPATLLYKILDRTAFEQSSFKTTLASFINILQAGRLPENIGQEIENVEPPTDSNKLKEELYALLVDGVEASWLSNMNNKKWETMLVSSTSLDVFRTLLTQPSNVLFLKNILQNILQYIPESLIQSIFKTYTLRDFGKDTLLYKILVTTASRPDTVKTTLTNFVEILNTGKIPEGTQDLRQEIEPATADEVIADLHALLVKGIRAAWIEQIEPKRWEAILISPVGLRFFKGILSLPKATALFIKILENMVRYLSPNHIQKVFQSYRRFDFGEEIVMFRILDLAETKRLNFRLAVIEFIKVLKEEKKKEDSTKKEENTTPPPVYAMRDDLNELFINSNKAAWIVAIKPQKWEGMLSSALGLKFFKEILTKPRTIRSLKKVLQNMLTYLPDTLLQKVFATYNKEELEQETLLFKILDVNEARNTSFKATLNGFITILNKGKLPTSPSQDPDSFASGEKVQKKKLTVEEKLKEDLLKYKTMAEQNETSTTALDIIEIVDYFLKTASLPVQSKVYDLLLFEKDFKQAIETQPKQIIDKIKALSRDAVLQNTALGLLNKEIYELLIKKLQPVRATSLSRYFNVVHSLSSSIIHEGLPNLHVILYASKAKAENINAAHYIQDFVKLVVRENIANPIVVIEKIQKGLRETTSDLETSRDLLGHLEVLKNKTRVSKRLKHQTPRKPTETTSVPYPFKDGAFNQAIYIRNAGMVLLWPFLGHYFGRLKMLTHKNTFKTPEMAIRAVHLLQFLTTKHPGSEEHELMLNKILCGIPIDTPIPYGISLTEEERKLSESLLRAVIQQWKALGNSSVDGLRGGFLIRDGRLQKTKSDKWTLRIEKKPYDILLGKLPWGYSMVKVSWMPNILTVEWG